MSRILRRPMFRGGPVDSRGTGITSGLMDGGRVGFKFGNTYNNLTDLRQVLPYNMTGQEIMDKYNVTFPINPKSLFIAENPEPQNIETTSEGDTFFTGGKPDFKKDTKYYPGQDDPQGSQDEITKGMTTEKVASILKPTNINNDTTDNNTSSTEISAQDLIRENAELFKELLGEGQEEKIKKARIGDASDYLLKFFEGSQKEGATVGSSAADVAGFATSKDSRVDKAKAANEKIDQTATVLAINDYIAGKRSKEDIQKALSLAAATAKMKEGSIGDQILAVAARQTLTGGKIKEILGAAVGDGEAKGIRTIPSGEENNYKPGPEDEGFFFFEEGTKNVFKFEDGVLKNVYRPN